MPQQREYSWEVEQDAMAWETAVGGMATLERQLRELRSQEIEATECVNGHDAGIRWVDWQFYSIYPPHLVSLIGRTARHERFPTAGI